MILDEKKLEIAMVYTVMRLFANIFITYRIMSPLTFLGDAFRSILWPVRGPLQIYVTASNIAKQNLLSPQNLNFCKLDYENVDSTMFIYYGQ
jgi:hypothetical protein